MNTTRATLLTFALITAVDAELRPQTQSAPIRRARILGQVLDRNGKPAVGATVSTLTPKRSLRSLPISSGHDLPDAKETEKEISVRTDADGQFRIEVEEFGWHGLIAEQDQEAASTLLFPVMAGETVLLRLEGTRTVEGKVVEENDGTEVPLAGTPVECELVFGTSHGNRIAWSDLRRPKWIKRTLSNPDGSFSFQVPESASIEARASASGRSPASVRRGHDIARVLTLRLAPELAVRGVVVDAKTQAPVAGARVFWRIDGPRAVTTDESGRFVLPMTKRICEVLVVSDAHRLGAATPSTKQCEGHEEFRFELLR